MPNCLSRDGAARPRDSHGGARSCGEARRGDLRWAFAEGFRPRLQAHRHGLGRRAKYLWRSASGELLLMQFLGMSGSFRVRAGIGETHERREPRPGPTTMTAPKPRRHDHVVFHMCRGVRVSFNDRAA